MMLVMFFWMLPFRTLYRGLQGRITLCFCWHCMLRPWSSQGLLLYPRWIFRNTGQGECMQDQQFFTFNTPQQHSVVCRNCWLNEFLRRYMLTVAFASEFPKTVKVTTLFFPQIFYFFWSIEHSSGKHRHNVIPFGVLKSLQTFSDFDRIIARWNILYVGQVYLKYWWFYVDSCCGRLVYNTMHVLFQFRLILVWMYRCGSCITHFRK